MKILITFFLTLFLTLQDSSVFAVAGLSNPLRYNDLQNLLDDIPNILVILATIIFVSVLVIGGIKYMTAMGNEESSQKAKNTLTWGVIGLVVVLLAKSFMDWYSSSLPELFIK